MASAATSGRAGTVAGAGPARQPLAPIRSDFSVRFHDEAGLEPLHDATLRLLETTGVRFESPKALAILKKAGAKADEGSDLVRLPRRLVEEALAPAPRQFTLGARDASCDLQLGSGSTYGTTDGCGVEVVDWHTGERRSSTKADLEADHAHAGLPRLHQLLVAHGQRRRLRRDRPAARDRGRVEQYRQAPDGYGAGRDPGAGRPSRWRPRSPAGPKSSAAGPS